MPLSDRLLYGDFARNRRTRAVTWAPHAVPFDQMHEIVAAKVKPGVRVDDLPGSDAASGEAGMGRGVIRGKALIFWDPKLPGTKFGRKLDAIDTDQITPAADCVS